MARTLVLFLLINILTNLNASRILAVLPTPSISHQIAFRPLVHELAKRGHEVTVITPDPAFPKGQSPANLTEIDVHDLSYSFWLDEMKKVAVGDEPDMPRQIEMFIVLLSSIFREQLLSEQVQEHLDKNKHFDLLIIEACVRPALILSHVFKAPVILVSSMGSVMGLNKKIGISVHPFLYQSSYRQHLYNLTLWEKVKGAYDQVAVELMYEGYESKENKMLQEIYGPDIPSLSELSENIAMFFLNVHSIWCENQPMPPSVVFMGGIHQRPEQKLPQDLLSYLDSSKHGVIYISFGTNVQPSVLPPQKISTMVKVFSELPYDVIWKWDTELKNKSKNIKVMNWLPQPDLLRHPKVRLFITQGGLQSTEEAITAGLPLIGIPIIADQWYNTEKYVRHGIGVQLLIDTFTEDDFKNAILTVIENKSYRNNIVKLRSIMYDQPQTPLERTVWWTEHVLRHGGARHLRTPAANMSWGEYYELKFVSVIFAFILLTLIVFCMALYYIRQWILKQFFTSPKIKKS